MIYRVSPIRSERLAAALLLAAASTGLLLANSPLSAAAFAVRDVEFGPPGLTLSAADWISEGLLALFFFSAAIELKFELTRGELASPAKAMRPAVAAVFGVAAPALIYLAVAGRSGYAEGWPIPTATDIAFALGILSLFGRGLPSRIRAFLLALAILDDLIAITLIAAFFTRDLDVAALGGGALAVAGVAVVSRIRRRWAVPLVIVLALAAWWLVHASGVHSTIAGVAVGLALPGRLGMRVRHAIEPGINGVVLPLFALSAAMVAVPPVSPPELTAPFWAILVALPVGKMVGIGVGGWLGTALEQRRLRPQISPFALVTVGALGGIGFTVSLLMNELAFAGQEQVRSEGILAVLIGSGVSMIIASALVAALRRRMRASAPGASADGG
ncbi:MAG: Na+/H+ antiporter NhaA [Micrococcales bacterium]|nr:Na+/H+ antiporter NhaA [Micrococcales bacterium]